MRKIAALFFVLTTATLSAAFQTPVDWIKFTSDEGRFSILMPGPDAPKDDPETATDTKVGQYTVHRFLKRTDKGVFIIGWVDYAPRVQLDVQGELAANRDNFIKGLNAKVTSERAIKLDEYPGIEFVSENADAIFKSRIYIIGQRPYMVVAATIKGMDDAENVNKFLSSFELKKPGD